MEAKKGNLKLLVKSYKKLPDVAVCMNFKVDGSACALNNIRNGHSCCQLTDEKSGKAHCCYPKGTEEMAICYAVFCLIREKLSGSPLDVAKSRSGAVNCGYHDGHFFICWNTQGSLSMIRKTLSIAVRCLVPEKLYAAYQKFIRQIGGKPSREEFNYCANDILSSLKSSICCVVVGKTNVDQAQLDLALTSILAKAPSFEAIKDKKTQPSDHHKCNHADQAMIPVKGWLAAVMRDFLVSKVKGLNATIMDDGLLLNVAPNVWKTLSSKLQKILKLYTTAKFVKLGDDLGTVYGYMMISNSSMSCPEVVKLIGSKPTASSVEALLKKVL